MIKYKINDQYYYDSTMIKCYLGITRSKLQKIMSKYKGCKGDYIRYFNKILYKENYVLDMIEFVMKEKNKKMKNESIKGKIIK